MQSGQNDGAAGAAACGGTERVRKKHAICCEPVEVWRLRRIISVAPHRRALIIGDEQHNVPFRRRRDLGEKWQE
jgi:hypothetical protein